MKTKALSHKKEREKLSHEEKARLVIDYARKDLITYCQVIDPSYRANWHHELIAEKLMAVERGDIRRLMIFSPPRHGKSRLITEIFPTWYLGKNTSGEVITASNTEDLAKDFGRKAREIIKEPVYKAIFGLSLRADEKGSGKWKTEKGGSYTSVGIGGTITGRGASLAIIDDPIKNAEDAQSILFRNKQWDWYRSVLYTRLMNREGKQGAIVIVLTRWHNDDLAGRLLEQMAEGTGDNWEVLTLPAIAEEDEEFRKSGEALWEQEFPLKRLNDTKRIVGPYVWNSLYQQKPISSENQLFVDSWFKYRDASEVDALSTRNFLTIDTAVSEIGDYTGFCDNRVDTQNMWNIRAWRERIKPNDLLDKLFYLHHTNRYEKIGIEKTIYKQAIQPFLDDEMRKRNQFLPIVELSHGGKAKEERIKWLVPRYSSGSIYHVRGLTSDLEEELLQFPKAKYDDVCLAGETIVATEFGDKKISDIRKGDKVITPFGLRKVLWAGKTGEKEVIQRRGIVGTKNHRIFSGKHFDNLDAITYNSNVSVFSLKNTIVWMYKKLLFSMEKPSALWEGRESIILVNQKTGKILKDFTLRFGNFIRRRKFLLAIVFTIKTAILIITALKIWIVYKVANTFHTILRKIGQKTERKNSKILEKQENLERKTRIITVYNIEVEEDGVFYAENILVSNCDATAYQAQIASASMESNWDEEAFQELSLNTDW